MRAVSAPALALLTGETLATLIAAGCPNCRRHQLRVRALATAKIKFLDGEPVSELRFEAPPESRPERIYRVECVECGAALFERLDCPLCRSTGGLARALGGRHGLTRESGSLPRNCPRCGWEDLPATVAARMHLLLLNGALSRRVVDAEPHEPGFHVSEVACPDCAVIIASVPSLRCAACGRSSLMKRPG